MAGPKKRWGVWQKGENEIYVQKLQSKEKEWKRRKN